MITDDSTKIGLGLLVCLTENLLLRLNTCISVLGLSFGPANDPH